MDEYITMTYMTTFGDFGARGSDAYSHSFVFDLTLTEKLNWIIQSDLLRVGSTGEDNVGLNQYFIYTMNDRVSLGSRMEWWKGDSLTGYAPHGGVVPATGSHSYYESTFGVNYKINSNITLRPEYRYDWSPAVNYEQGTFGIDMVATF
ncbi:MAG: outer membrane beta-barrel protein [Mariniblastus sp.]